MQPNNNDKTMEASHEQTTLPTSEETESLNDGLQGLSIMNINGNDNENDDTNDAGTDGIWLPHPNWLRPVGEDAEDDYSGEDEQQQQ
ncbi:expressed unknown protein [Seminavis robusta]|uniref:Uncharacterized protein n=1 Tax=Seminavis robusta TaxID=568900 RepID=A0A9N8EVP1_9STRA|nr:expressed unknown protein [Seminavis robusta]|eukprot:Sro2123_g315550.1 n/a (87) ;mRNA; f:5773-6033